MLKRFCVEDSDAVLVPEAAIRLATEKVFSACGLTEESAKTCAGVLLTNDLRGNDSHGVSNMLRQYVNWYRKGTQNPRPNFKVIRETPGTALVDADGGLGLHAAQFAMQMAVDKAKAVGIGCVSVRNAGHLGGAGPHASVASEQGCIGQVFGAPGGGLMCPTFGAEPRFGTHPLAWAAPAGKEAPFLFDVATTQVAGNKIRLASRLGVKLAANWVTKEDGTVIEEEVHPPEKFFMTPMGGTRDNASHKGYGLACVADILCNTMPGIGAGFLTGGGGLLFVAYHLDAFAERPVYDEWMDKFLEGLRTTPPVPGEERVLYPGLYAHECTQKRRRDGIPYHPEVLHWYQLIAAELKDEALSAAVAALPKFKASEEQQAKWREGMKGMLGLGSMSHGGGDSGDMSAGKWRGEGTKVTILDGSMGRQLVLNGMPQDDLFYKIWSARALADEKLHDLVVQTHRSYIDAGAEVLTTNCYGVQPTFYRKAFPNDWETKMIEHAELGARLAIRARDEAGKPGVRVFGCLPPLCESHRPEKFAEFVKLEGEEFVVKAFRSLATAAIRGGVDGLIAETMNCWEEAALALRGCQDLGKPMIVSLEGALRDVDLQPHPARAAEIARRATEAKLAGAPIEVLGFNCAGPEELLQCLQAIEAEPSVSDGLRSAGISLGCYANCNNTDRHKKQFKVAKADSHKIKLRSDLGDDGFSGYVDFARKFREHGATYIGGCCGCGPEGITGIANLCRSSYSGQKRPAETPGGEGSGAKKAK